MHRPSAARASLVLIAVAACGQHAAPTTPASTSNATAPARDPVPTCPVDGEWTVEWQPVPMVRETGWGLPRTFTLLVRPGESHAYGLIDGGPGTRSGGALEIDRVGCLAHGVLTMNISFSDDAGSRDDLLTLDLAFDGDTAALRGRYRVEDTSETPIIDADVRVTGRVTRVPELSEE